MNNPQQILTPKERDGVIKHGIGTYRRYSRPMDFGEGN